ncbi:hypothetical protein [Pyxidicoccus xibeiensis]|uniref:hypothetical protein n=1 Tax=Pyxidicoccus xibeiensis TaxID=2906759 RepID=UPI0020A7C8B3|nr:hypothetical protein [Pyxidicoccus xibeiensis]MCP3145342.1 hypothetical protein [Pyxidicoccus xibeiensis]
MVNQDPRAVGADAPVENINPKDPPPEITKGLVAQPYSAKLSVPTSAVESPSDEDGGAPRA